MRRVWVLAALTVSLLAALTSPPPTAVACDTFDGNKMIGGVDGRLYWLDGSVGSHLSSEIYSAKWLWGNATSKVAWAETPTKISSVLDFYHSSQPLPYCARVYMYLNGSIKIDPEWQDWNWAKVAVSDYWNSAIECPNQRGVVTHEIGHAMGLAHVYHPTTAIMRYEIASLSYAAPKLDDLDGINGLY